MSQENVEIVRDLEDRIFAIGRIRPRGTAAHGAR